METNHHAHSGDKSHLPGLEGFLDTYLRIKAPVQLPVKVKEFLVNYGPWITLIILIIAAFAIIPLTLLALGLTAVSLPFAVAAGQAHVTMMNFAQIIVGAATLVIEAVAIPGLLKRKLSAWRLVYYAAILPAVGALLSLDFFGLVIGLVLSMYVLFQIREYYK